MSAPAIKMVKSTFGGGWVIPLNLIGRRALAAYYQEAPTEITPLGGEQGWIVEPQDAGDLAEYLKGEGIAWEIGA